MVNRSFGRKARFGKVLTIAILLTGCAVGPDYLAPPTALPVRWSSDVGKRAVQPLVLAQWWHHRGDPMLDRLIDEAVQGNLDVAAAKARIREARALRQETIGALFPEIAGSGSASANRLGTVINGLPNNAGALHYNAFQAGFDSSWELDLFGANRSAIEAASYNVDAAEDDLRATLLTLIGDVASYYIDARGYQARAALARRTADSQRVAAALSQTKLDAGLASAVDVAKAMAQAASTEATIPTDEALYEQSLHRLGVLLGLDPSALASRFARATPIPRPRLPLPKGIPADVLTMRPDVRRAERQLAQSTAKIGQAEAARYPDISLSGSISTTALKLGDLGKNSTIGWSVGPTLSVPIFNAGKLRAAVEIAGAQRDQSYIAWRSAVLSALEDVENAIVALDREKIRVRKLAVSARRFGEAALLSHALYETGSSSFLDVLDAERSRFSAEDSLLQSRISIAKDYVALAKSLGGGWDGDVDSTTPEVVDGYTGPHLAKRHVPE
jgi:outer membrane protein, multidrug efflux system